MLINILNIYQLNVYINSRNTSLSSPSAPPLAAVKKNNWGAMDAPLGAAAYAAFGGKKKKLGAPTVPSNLCNVILCYENKVYYYYYIHKLKFKFNAVI